MTLNQENKVVPADSSNAKLSKCQNPYLRLLLAETEVLFL